MKAIRKLLALVTIALATLGLDSTDAPPRPNVSSYAFTLPGYGRPHVVIGEMNVYKAKPGETFLDIGRRADLGVGELEEANPGVDPWLPSQSPYVLLPSAFIVPRSGYTGLVINIPEMRMYYFPGTPGRVVTFPLGLGPYDWQTPRGVFHVARKEVNPTWVIPTSIRRTMEFPRSAIPPGPDNPLGKYRFVLSIPSYGIHGTNRPWGVGRYYSHGCIRMYPEDIHWLFERVERGFPVEIIYQPVKVGLDGDQVFVEVHRDPYRSSPDSVVEAWRQIGELGVRDRVDRQRLERALQDARGFPVNVTKTLGLEEAEKETTGPG